jgi:hypothetical protein
MTFKKKNKQTRGTFVSQKDEAVLKKAQKLRLIFMYSSTLTLALILFIPQEWAKFAKNIVWLQTLYVLLIFVLIIVSVAASYGASRNCNVTKPIDEKRRPKTGFEKRTFVSVELFSALHFLHAAAQMALFIYGVVSYGFNIWDICAAILGCGGAAFAYMFRLVTFRTLKEDLLYIPPKKNDMVAQETANEKTDAIADTCEPSENKETK